MKHKNNNNIISKIKNKKNEEEGKMKKSDTFIRETVYLTAVYLTMTAMIGGVSTNSCMSADKNHVQPMH